MKKAVRYFLIALIVLIIGHGEYQIFIKGPEYAKPQSGTVMASYESSSKYSSTCFAGVKFDNGDYEIINTGHYRSKVGERITTQLSWNPILGTCGYAYGWDPGNWLVFAIMPAFLFNISMLVYLVYRVFKYAFS